MPVRRTVLAVLAGTALVAALAAPAGAGTLTTLTVSPNPATTGSTVTVTPLAACPDLDLGAPTVSVQIVGPDSDAFYVEVDPVDFDWSATFTAGAEGVYTLDVSCNWPDAYIDYAAATLQVVAPAPTTTSSSTTSTSGPTTSTTGTTATTGAPAATAPRAVAARPAYTG